MSGKYDPATGELLNEISGENDKEMKEGAPSASGPVRQGPDAAAPGPAMHFDPMTGEPVMGRGYAPDINFIEPSKQPEKNKTKLWIGLGVAAAVLVVAVSAVVAAVLKSGILMSNSGKVLSALANTMAYRSHLAEDLAPLLSLAEDDHTISIEVEMPEEDAAVEIKYRSQPSEKQLEGGIDITYLPTIHFIASMDSEKVRIHIPFLDKRIFTYNYMEEKTGFLAELLSEEELEEMDAVLESLFREQGEEHVEAILSGRMMEWYHSFELEKAGTKEYEVNGTARKCTGYRFTVTSEDMLNLLEDMDEVLFGNYPEELYNPYADFFDELWYTCSDMQDMDVTFYLYKNRVECIHMEEGGEELDILFESDKKGNLDVEFIFMGETVLQIRRKITDSIEECRIRGYSYGGYLLDMVYHYKTGDFTVDIEDDHGEYYFLEGNLQSDAKSAAVTLETADYYGDELNLKITVEEGASMVALEGTEVDLGNLSEDDWYDLLEDFLWY